MHFKNRESAAKQLSNALGKYKGRGDVIVFAPPRGGVVLGTIVARALEAPLDLILPRKVGHPYNPEYAIAAVTETGKIITNDDELAHIDAGWLKKPFRRKWLRLRADAGFI